MVLDAVYNSRVVCVAVEQLKTSKLQCLADLKGFLPLERYMI